MSSPTILVCGASSGTGKATAEALLLLSRSYPLRVKVGIRDPKKLEEWRRKGAEPVLFDMAEKDSIRAALEGVDRIWITPPNPSGSSLPFERIRLALNVIDAAKLAESVRFVLLGSVPDADRQVALFERELGAAEEYLQQSGLSYSILRMSIFTENFLAAQEFLRQGVVAVPLGEHGRYAPTSHSDIGAMAAAILASPSPHHASVYTITGPESLSGERMAELASKVLNRSMKYVDAPPKALYDLFEHQVGMPHWQVRGLLELYEQFQKKPQLVSNDFEKVVGRKATPFDHRLIQLRHAGLLKV